MNEICYDQRSSTFSQVVIAGIMAQALYAIPTQNTTIQQNQPLLQRPYSLDDNKATYSIYRAPITGEYVFASKGFEQSVGDFYARLLARQEPLGAVFEKILHENLWDLYES